MLLIDRVGRRPLIIYPTAVIIVNFVLLAFVVPHKDTNQIFEYMVYACILISCVCFGIGLGPIPYLYTVEVFPQNSRSTAMAFSILVNLFSGLLFTVSFPVLFWLIVEYVFSVFGAILLVTWLCLLFKVNDIFSQ
jgi:SP family xylose:H+ symportor-like MFS transporter